ncbi:hypothetical protein CERZMDRAFT_88795 [Cercospora zeae-maydis SCOH1-5]|uniref:Uncharacterized protein n=1 Tax=Cercospora zeae-maydis SCOH1-5 TaxID=717836 RepID=A0A6A6EXS7_9PEZI|nr:hypothetical protein CERZMDRAFT_88795 [Cercospora zeae-maydis SCOH1-5]
MALTDRVSPYEGGTESVSLPRISSIKSDGPDPSLQRQSTRSSEMPETFAHHDASDYLSEIQDLVHKTDMHSDGASSANYSLNGGSTSRKSRHKSAHSRFSSSQGNLQSVVLDQSTFTKDLIKRLMLTRRLSSTLPNTLPPAIETYFEINTIRIEKSAAILPSWASSLPDQLHPLLALHIRHLELRIKLSFRPIFGSLQRNRRFEVKAEHVSHCSTSVPNIVDQLPRLRTIVIVFDSLFDLPPRPSDYQRFLRTHHYHAGASREDNITNSDMEERMKTVIVPGLRQLASETTRLSRVALKHHPGTTVVDEPMVVNGVNCSDGEVASAVLARHGTDVVLKGWL